MHRYVDVVVSMYVNKKDSLSFQQARPKVFKFQLHANVMRSLSSDRNQLALYGKPLIILFVVHVVHYFITLFTAYIQWYHSNLGIYSREFSIISQVSLFQLLISCKNCFLGFWGKKRCHCFLF